MHISTPRILHAAEAATQPIPTFISQNYGGLFKIQRVHNVFPLKPVSFSSLTAYLECPGCALDQKRRKRPKEPAHFSEVQQSTLFGKGMPDPRLVGTLLHQVINLLHETEGPLSQEQRAELFSSSDKMIRFVRRDLLGALQDAQKLKLAMFFNEMCGHEDTLRRELILPLLRYQRELIHSDSVVFARAERFQFRLVSTGQTFVGHSDWGGDVAIVGEFDQIRLRNIGSMDGGRPAIIEFKAGLGKKRNWDQLASALDDTLPSAETVELQHPGMAHALQLAIYWLAFQTRWDILERIHSAKGRVEDVSMPFQQDLDLILYNLQNGTQYQLLFSDTPQALRALTNCIFHLNWAMKSGYAWQAPEHECGKTALLSAVPIRQVQVGADAISAQECYLLAREAFRAFKELIIWQPLTACEAGRPTRKR